MGENFFRLAEEFEIAPILIFAPTSTDARMAELNRMGQGFIYCVARRGVTGKKSEFGDDFIDLSGPLPPGHPPAAGRRLRHPGPGRCPALTGKADMAVIGSRTIRLVDEKGPEAVGPFIAGLR